MNLALVSSSLRFFLVTMALPVWVILGVTVECAAAETLQTLDFGIFTCQISLYPSSDMRE
jgi:hypothetical protein